MRKNPKKIIEKDIKLDPICNETLLNYYTQGGGEIDQVKTRTANKIPKPIFA